MATLPDLGLCGGPDNVNDGCGVIFQRMNGNICALCKKLKVTGLSAEQRATLRETLVQCSECGLCGSTLNDPCGTCKRKSHAENGSVDAESLAAQNQRRRQIDSRLVRPQATSSIVGSTTPITELANLRANAGKVSTFTVFIEVRRSTANSVDKVLGKTCVPYPETTTFQALKEMAVADINPRWTQTHTSDLQLDEVELRGRNNIALQPNIDFATLRQWYNTNNVVGTREALLKPPVGVKNAKGSAFCLELFVHEDRYYERTRENDSDIDGSEGESIADITNTSRKRKLSNKRGRKKNGGNASKRPKGRDAATTLKSSFVPDAEPTTAGLNISSANTIVFHRTVCTINAETGRYSFTEQNKAETGLLNEETLFLSATDRGKTKDVYGLIIGGREYVAKKLIDAGRGRGILSLDDQLCLLLADLIRLKRMEFFADAFFAHVTRKSAEIASFQISEGFIIKSYQNTASAAIPENITESGTTRTLLSVYLVEPRRASSAVLKFSGTLGMHNRIEKRSATIMAFSHFVLEHSACKYMFSDIQGSMDRCSTTANESILTLFDPMTHTPNSKSGLGDHGPNGISDFIKRHKCTAICLALNLCKMSVLQITLKSILDDINSDEEDTPLDSDASDGEPELEAVDANGGE